MVLTFEFGWKLVDSLTQEEGVGLLIPVFGPTILDQFLGGVNSVDIGIAFFGEHFSDLTCATANVEDL